MKKIYLLLFSAFILLNSCSTTKFNLGMSEQEFVQKNRVELIETSNSRNVYKKTIQPFGKPAKYKFFYFIDGKLARMDEGQRNPDILIENKY